MSERWLRASALASLAALVSLAGLIWLQHRAAQHSERYAQQLQSWLALESQQSAELLRVRSGLVGHYDGIVQTVAARRRALSALTPLPALVTGPGRAELERTLAQALSERVSTEWLIERCKREHSVLRISMRFLPRLAAELEPQRAGEVQEPWQGVANGIVQDALLFQHWQERDDTRLSPAHLPAKLMQPLAAGPATLDKASDPRAALLEQMEQMERQRIVQALAACDGNQTLAAEQLGISRRTLVTRLAQFDLPRPRKVRQRAGDGS